MLQLLPCNNNNEDDAITGNTCKRPRLDTQKADIINNDITIKKEEDVVEEKVVVKPGWFGKGCRKRVTKRRRSSQVCIEDAGDEKVT